MVWQQASAEKSTERFLSRIIFSQIGQVASDSFALSLTCRDHHSQLAIFLNRRLMVRRSLLLKESQEILPFLEEDMNLRLL